MRDFLDSLLRRDVTANRRRLLASCCRYWQQNTDERVMPMQRIMLINHRKRKWRLQNHRACSPSRRSHTRLPQLMSRPRLLQKLQHSIRLFMRIIVIPCSSIDTGLIRRLARRLRRDTRISAIGSRPRSISTRLDTKIMAGAGRGSTVA